MLNQTKLKPPDVTDLSETASGVFGTCDPSILQMILMLPATLKTIHTISATCEYSNKFPSDDNFSINLCGADNSSSNG